MTAQEYAIKNARSAVEVYVALRDEEGLKTPSSFAVLTNQADNALLTPSSPLLHSKDPEEAKDRQKLDVSGVPSSPYTSPSVTLSPAAGDSPWGKNEVGQ